MHVCELILRYFRICWVLLNTVAELEFYTWGGQEVAEANSGGL